MSNKTNQAIVLSVSAGKGCYRHISVNLSYTLEELADIILWAFDFINDHAHAFFMNNCAWDTSDCYYMEAVDFDGEYRHTCDYTLGELSLQKGDAFKFVFDFGDEWVFQCKVLRIVEVSDNDAEIIREVGESPEQYMDYDEF